MTAGATEAIAAAVMGLAGPGDEVVMFEPYYDSYAACVALGGATRRTVTLRRSESGWTFDPADLAAAITPRTKAILLNTPHNPTGKVFTRAELEMIAEQASRNDLTVIADEVYEHLTFDGREHIPIATLPGMRDRTVTHRQRRQVVQRDRVEDRLGLCARATARPRSERSSSS